jgi:hypothetical protein
MLASERRSLVLQITDQIGRDSSAGFRRGNGRHFTPRRGMTLATHDKDGIVNLERLRTLWA